MRLLGLALPAAVSLTACWDLPPGDKTSPYFWSELFLDKYADELVVGELEPGPTPLAEPRAVLLITGVTIESRWFDPIVARLERDGFVPIVYEPPELLSGDLFEASEDLVAIVDDVLEETGQDKIDILAECTGGVIARHYIQSLGGDAKVSRMVTFVSPQQGVAKAPLAASIAGWPALYDLTPGSDFLRAVNDAPLPANVPFTSIYTCSDEYIQPYETSIIPGATNIGLCDGFVGHFQTFYDPAIYRLMFDALTAPLPGEPAPTEPAPTEPAPTEPAPTEPAPTEPAPVVGATPIDPAAEEPAMELAAREPESLACAGGSTALGLALLLAALVLVARARAARATSWR
ncbi:MAG: hypothetical protein IT385_21485 [Deltaproteobacteria bacterium]|nr:hypothetical protein [Deltaproteobacteria bacterium]